MKLAKNAHKAIIVCLVELALLFSVEGVSMSITPSSMVVGSARYVTRLELRCTGDGTNNNGIYSLEILRRRFTEIGYSSLAYLDVLNGIKQDPNLPEDIVSKSPNITGGLAGTPPTSGTLTLTMDGGCITCNDQAEFRCEMSYKITEVTGYQTAHESTNFTVITVPSYVRIIDAVVEERGIRLQLCNDSKLNVGTRITYKCSANIGSDSSLAIIWERSSMLGTATDFTAYTPTVSTDIVQEPVVQGSCSYTRTSTMYYNMTSMDDDGITFRCKVRVYMGNQWYEPTSLPRRTFAIFSSSADSLVNTGIQEAVPSDVRITDAVYEKKGIQIQLCNNSKLNVGTRITYRCSANIGSDSSLAIIWERSSMLGTATDFTAYTPTVSTDIVQEPVVQDSCSYTRTSTMYYNMTSMDDDGITFRCKVQVYVGNQWYEPTSIPRRTFAISTSSGVSTVNTGGKEVSTSSGGSTANTSEHKVSTSSGGSTVNTGRKEVSTSSGGSTVNTSGQEGSSGNSSTVLAAVLGVVVGVSVILLVILFSFLHRSRKLTKELQRQLQSRSHTYDGLMETVVTSEPYAILNLNPPENHLQSNYLNPYDRLNRTVGSSEPYDMLESRHSDANVHQGRNRTMCDEVGL